ncbi:MAG: hypothetical protein A3H69_01670 [Candidatus Sungbacteria bacterium RIFCSPLOWO2_02_FULL_47_9]|uniref:Uncharacterized protein n=1 Tax=Candidatus Sungbacteria bacterium RIFCSPHIGHO2_01_FULL_47_32 TaxID=1802264 RepID=A0A1G2K3T1_9BACT|nr:MAG: hypothetical protein UX72_C0022G0015 [Parcubacteria group bacterium GW2011_GWA2_47_10]OGZ94072.1 MAG: hypothetical protein A2633_03860 [Candidatus Sungbacteria bacterium RIFCSPHIGHO2_01_FULL_47_32]OGZ98509.1 MAG: hypothetical protein A3D57_00055 [Candidatus Sungbacteria bacterium RIFCSPHIGHO2_02_FULL_46_12]OHA05290.1 MAG: hypothetical protein A3A28_01745 [Candidatus Sungbacteria bacterium RIFCSPLOWO2_01_FULL_47_32]OHA11754.1 MAG: hypothetical protein A3H69_01670 [Candidatus Sungbacteria
MTKLPLMLIRRRILDALNDRITELERKNSILLRYVFDDVKEKFLEYQRTAHTADRDATMRSWRLCKLSFRRMKNLGLEKEALQFVRDLGTTRKILSN